MNCTLASPSLIAPRVAATLVVAAGVLIGDVAPAQSPDPRGAVRPFFVPNVPEAVSRPAAWPDGGAGAAATQPDDGSKRKTDPDRFREAVDKEKHVLSSIRDRPGAPLEPLAVSGGELPAPDAGVIQAAFEQAAGGQPTATPEAISLDTAAIVARVGPEVVLESDLLTPKALDWLESVSPTLKPEQIRQLRLQICRQVIDQHIETLLVYVDACREIPEDKLPEIRKNVDKAFDEQYLPKLMQEAKAANSLEYERSLRAKGQSLERMRKMFFERGVAQEWMRKHAGGDEEVAHADMIAWYQNHLADYDFPAKARYEALMVKTGLKRSRQEAWQILASMGNEVLAGRPFADVAKARSEGPTAAAGGACDWITKGSLSSRRLDEAIFSLPVGELSSIIEEEQSLHIVRVIERKEAGRTPFLEAQVAIRAALEQERREKKMDDYLTRLRERTPVWTIFDGQPGGPAATASRGPADSTTRR